MAEPFLAEIRLFSFGYPPKGWALCNGQLLPINQNQALFSLLGTTYGGDGRTTFALPDLRGRVPVHWGNDIRLGQSGGEETHLLTELEIPGHIHMVSATSDLVNPRGPVDNVWGIKAGYFSNVANTTMNQTAISTVGGNQPHENRQPYFVLNFCIAMQGIFPIRD